MAEEAERPAPAQTPVGARYEIVYPRGGMDRFSWAVLAGLVALVVFAPLALKIVAAAALVLSLAALLAHRFHRQFVELEEGGLLLRLGYGPAIRIAFAELEDVRPASPRRFWGLMAVADDSFTEIALRRRRLVLVLTPFPLIWPARRLRIPVAEREAFIAAVRERIAVDASAHSF